MRPRPLTVAALSVLLASCAAGTTSELVTSSADFTAETAVNSIRLWDLVECDSTEQESRTGSRTALLDAPGWIGYDADAITSSLETAHPTDFGGIALSTVGAMPYGETDVPDVVYVHKSVVSELETFVENGASIVFPIYSTSSERGLSTQLAFDVDDFTFVNGCLQDVGRFIHEFATQAEPEISMAVLVRRLIDRDSELRRALGQLEREPPPIAP